MWLSCLLKPCAVQPAYLHLLSMVQQLSLDKAVMDLVRYVYKHHGLILRSAGSSLWKLSVFVGLTRTALQKIDSALHADKEYFANNSPYPLA